MEETRFAIPGMDQLCLDRHDGVPKPVNCRGWRQRPAGLLFLGCGAFVGHIANVGSLRIRLVDRDDKSEHVTSHDVVRFARILFGNNYRFVSTRTQSGRPVCFFEDETNT